MPWMIIDSCPIDFKSIDKPKVLITKLNKLESPVMFESYKNHVFNCDDEPIEIKGGVYYYIITGKEKFVKKLCNKVKKDFNSLIEIKIM